MTYPANRGINYPTKQLKWIHKNKWQTYVGILDDRARHYMKEFDGQEIERRPAAEIEAEKIAKLMRGGN